MTIDEIQQLRAKRDANRTEIERLLDENRDIERRVEAIGRHSPSPGMPAVRQTHRVHPSPSPTGDFASLTAIDAARVILAEFAAESPGKHLHYLEITARAIDRGYKNKNAGDGKDAIARHFHKMMRRAPHLFARDGRWHFRLAREDEYIIGESSPVGWGRRLTRAEVAESMLLELGRPVTTIEIADRIETMGIAKTPNRKLLINTIYVAMTRSPRIARISPGLWGLAGVDYGKAEVLGGDRARSGVGEGEGAPTQKGPDTSR